MCVSVCRKNERRKKWCFSLGIAVSGFWEIVDFPLEPQIANLSIIPAIFPPSIVKFSHVALRLSRSQFPLLFYVSSWTIDSRGCNSRYIRSWRHWDEMRRTIRRTKERKIELGKRLINMRRKLRKEKIKPEIATTVCNKLLFIFYIPRHSEDRDPQMFPKR